METERLYKIVFYAGCGWNWITSIALFILIDSLPTLLGIDPPHYPIFIQFNLMSVFFFGWIQWIIARNLHGHRSFVVLLVWAKLSMIVIFMYSILLYTPSRALINFLAPGMIVDFLFGLLFWRFLVFSRTTWGTPQ